MSKPLCEVSAPSEHKTESYNAIKNHLYHYTDFFEVFKGRVMNWSTWTLVLTWDVRQHNDKKSLS